MAEIDQVARDLAGSLSAAEAETTASWAVASARRNRQTLETGVRQDGSGMPPNTEYTTRAKERRGLDTRAGVRTGALMRSLDTREALHPLNNSEAEVYGASGEGANYAKANMLIKGTQTKRGSGVLRTPPRDYVGHDPAVVEQAAGKACDLILRAWGFR